VLAVLQQVSPQTTATLDVDATIVESHKRSATTAYEGTRGYQPVVVVWRSRMRFCTTSSGRERSGGVRESAHFGARGGLLPPGVQAKYLRADSALYENEVLFYCEAEGIGYAISADLSPPLRAAILALPETAWQMDREEADAVREWAEVAYVPEDGDHRRTGRVCGGIWRCGW